MRQFRAHAFLIMSLLAAMVASLSLPLRGACGTAHWFLVALISESLGGRGLGYPVFVLLNTSLFAVPALLLHLTRRQTGRLHLPLLTAWTFAFLWSYFYAFPTRECP